jgi:atlastin
MALLPPDEVEQAQTALHEKLSTVKDAQELLNKSTTATSNTTDGTTTAAATVTEVSDISQTGGGGASSHVPSLKRQASSRLRKHHIISDPTANTQEELKPFQRLQFLVRDWQNFDKEYHEGDTIEAFHAIHAEMEKYLTEVLRTRESSDLQSTREQILRCFQKLDCFLLPHPGFSVVKKNYDGNIQRIQPEFRALINQYVRLIFDQELEAKLINNRTITGSELKTYFEVYVRMFQAESSFPKAMTMLDATAEANNRNAYDKSLHLYKMNMDNLVGKDKGYMKEMELKQQHEKHLEEAMDVFDSIATMGSETAIEKVRDTLLETIEGERLRYFTTNALRNPFKDIEFYLLPLAIALAAWVMSVVTDVSCSTDFCEAVEDTFENIYFYILFITIVLTWKQISAVFKYVKEMLPEVVQHFQQR